jgi:divalent metal cation (Fe/Co/Zn/Cd) transporter
LLNLYHVIYLFPGLAYFGMMEAIASFLILLIIYFLGILAVVQLVIRPVKQKVGHGDQTKNQWENNHLKILGLSFLLSLITTTIAYLIFP